jgi:DNA anti-recombination protein RmuC
MVPVSPKTFYDYLRAIAIGFRGLKIAQETRRIEQLLLGNTELYLDSRTMTAK